jgi:hypothetical protein
MEHSWYRHNHRLLFRRARELPSFTLDGNAQ